MNISLELFEVILDFSSTMLLVMLIFLVNMGLKWLPSKDKISFFLLLFLAFRLVTFAAGIFESELAYRFYILLLPSILIVGPLMTGFTQSSLLMKKTPLLTTKAMFLWFIGCIFLIPYLVYPVAITQLPAHQQPWLLVISVNSFVLLFTVSSSFYFIRMLNKFYRGALYAVGYSEDTYRWLKGVWFAMTLIWLSLLYNMISGVIDIPWYKVSLSEEIINVVTSLIDICVLFGLTIITVLYCKKPIEKSVVAVNKPADKYEKSSLSEQHAKGIILKIEQTMQTDKLFLDPSINIEKLASAISSPPQYLSQAINQYRNINFYELVANYRIEYAKTLLINQPDISILTVAMSAGFNAKSTFNHTFKKLTGLTPSAFKATKV